MAASNDLEFKRKVHDESLRIVMERIQENTKAIHEARESLEEDTKSSVGDKYETGREMAQQEMDKLQLALDHLTHMRDILWRMDPEKQVSSVELGALVQTTVTDIYVAASVGRVKVDDRSVNVISFSAPLIQALRNAKTGDTVEFNGVEYKIGNIV